MITMLADMPKVGRRHYVGGRVDPLAPRPPLVQNRSCLGEVERPPHKRAEGRFKRFPGVNAVEQLKQDCAEEELARILASVGALLDITD